MSDNRQIMLVDEYATPNPMMDAYLEAISKAFTERWRAMCLSMGARAEQLRYAAFDDDRFEVALTLAAMGQHSATALRLWRDGKHREAFREVEWALEKGRAVE